MSLPTGYRRTDVPFERRTEMIAIDEWAFAMTRPPDVREAVATATDWSRARGVETDGSDDSTPTLVAVHASYGYTMRVPGGSVAASGLTWVGVHPAHRRRGILNSIIGDHFERSRKRGEIVSTLTAAETMIYQRFGYGLSCPTYTVSLPRGMALRGTGPSEGLRLRIEDADLATHATAVRAVLARDERPGAMTVVDDAMLANQFFDPEQLREGKEQKRIAIIEDDLGPAAFAIFQRKLTWTNQRPQGQGATEAWAAVNAAAARRLWSVLADLDLMVSFEVAGVPLDDPLVHLAADIRALAPQLRDQVWLRILDVPAALTARSYGADIDEVIDVSDHLVAENAHRWRLHVKDGRATVVRAERGSSVSVGMSIQDLSAAYLGGTTIESIAAAGLIEEVRPGSVAALSDAFRARQAPRSSFVF
ncbi:GNAT family N-acetyltransferase [Demequina lutea]|uniref:Putative acetyltransferase n=1 Tax=Demequina lutea TaxID=431489 RepID=A0A7Y9ZDF4_9MICO|nr:GNAT family N-acetyltransferase [Demequina lutea]NYI41935.1 putative acetyltransferase [Demequina lutea]